MDTTRAVLLVVAMVTNLAYGGFWPLSSDPVKNRIEVVLKQLPLKLTADPSGRSAQEFINRERLVIDTIQPYFYAVHGALHETSPAREERVKQVESCSNHSNRL